MEEEPYGLGGIQNMGNTCYANSVIQAIRVIPEIIDIINRSEPEETPETTKYFHVFKAYQDMLRTLWDKRTKSGTHIVPRKFWSFVHEAVRDTNYEQFATHMPQDAHEFLNYILDCCHEVLKTEAPEEEAPMYSSLGGFTSPIVDSLFGWDKKEITCEQCGNVSRRFEAFNMLKVGLNKLEPKPLKELLEDERRGVIEGYKCDNCNSHTNATFKLTFWKLPRTLFYVLRRFNPDGTKDCSPFSYDGEAIELNELFASDATDSSKEYSYRPISIIDHLGSHRGGHYIAQTYHYLLRKWFIYDDESCRELVGGPVFNPNNYIIVFRATA